MIPSRLSGFIGGMARTSRPVSAAIAVAAVAVGVITSMCGCATAPQEAPPTRLAFPSPAAGPGHPVIDRAAQRSIDAGWNDLLESDANAARKSAAQAGPGPAAELLGLQAMIVADDGDPIPGLRRLTDAQPDYAAAWITLSVAAEEANNESLALAAADRGADLWPIKRWQERADQLHQRWVEGRISSAQHLYEAKQPADALETLAPALALEPGDRPAVLLKARILLALNEPDRAEAALASLPRDDEVVLLSGNIAEARGDLNAALRIYASLTDNPEATLQAIDIAETLGEWSTAMNLWSSLPDDTPEKALGLSRAKLRWRLSVMPDYVADAVRSSPLDRAGLAVIIVSLAPKLGTLPGGQVPLLSDIMDMPSQNEILTAVRLGLIDSDQIDHSFDSNRPVTADEVRAAIDRLSALLTLDRPRWCIVGDDSPCTSLDPPISGARVAGMVIDLVAREGT